MEKRKLNLQIWKDVEEFREMYKLLLAMEERNLSDFPVKISLSKWSSLNAIYGYQKLREKRASS